MLELKIKAKTERYWNESKEEFVTINTPEKTIVLEHSLVSLSKWEAKYHKPFLATEKTSEEVLDYIKMMTITQNVDDKIYQVLSSEEIGKINEYIADPMTATKFYENSIRTKGPISPRQTEKITNEIIYHWMIEYGIPVEFQKWHLNRLLVLIRVRRLKLAEQNGKGAKMSKRDVLSQNRALNAARRQQLGTNG